ncbi:phage major capsid protein [Streptomyces sp. LZ34]
MAATDIIDSWIPIEWDSEVIQRVQRESAIEQLGYRVPMNTATKRILRSAGMTVTAGTTYTDDSSTNDYITLTARRFISKFTVDEDDLADASTVVDTIRIKGMDWAISYSDAFDNACIGVSASENGGTIPFTSAYKALRTTNSATSYTADDNYLSWDDDLIAIPSTPVGTSLYEKLSAAFKRVETGAFWSQADQFVIAAPGWRDALRLCTDNQGRPIFQPAAGSTPDSLFGAPITWSRGAKVAPTMSATPSGNDLLLFGNRSYLKKGERSQPESLVDQARAQDNTDDTAVKFRVRRAFQLAHEKAFSIVERITD